MSDELDPTLAPDARLSRRLFVGITAAGALGAPLASVAEAQTEFGRPHAPIVAENDPAITVLKPRLSREHGGAVDTYAAKPHSTDGPRRGVVIVHHIWGVDAQIRDVVRRFAKEGYFAIAPDLYSGLGAPNGDGSSNIAPFRPFAQKLADSQVDGDLALAADWLKQQSANGTAGGTMKAGVIGFCMGGTIALRQAVDAATTFDAVSVWYGKVRYGSNNNGAPTAMALAYADEVKLPVMGCFGERDRSILAEDVRAMQARLPATNDVKIYPYAGHAFFDDTRKSYVPAAATDGWTRALAWFSRYL